MFPGYNIVKHAFPGISDAKLAKNRLYVKEKTDLIENHIGEDARYRRFPLALRRNSNVIKVKSRLCCMLPHII